MNEKNYDRLLNIKTEGTLEGLTQSVHYNRYEATPYAALDELFIDYQLKSMDRIVDFGCGKGRFSFYVHQRFQVAVTGVEMSAHLYQEALGNRSIYIKKVKNASGSVHFERCLAEEYEIEQRENRFYFFNPFSVQIFMKVVDNILRSVEQQSRTVDLILYYPTAEYIHFLETNTAFELFKEVKVPELYKKNENERFLVFRLECTGA